LARAGTVWCSNSILTMQGVSLHGPDSWNQRWNEIP
jgi:hypothetical protein